MPRLWNDTIEAHRHSVQVAILDATASLVAQHGPASVTMSQVAQAAGIGRATLYKYFRDVDAILVAWHERQIGQHLQQLADARDDTASPGRQLEAVLCTFASISRTDHGGELSALLHRADHVARAHQHLRDFVTDLISRAAATGEVRDDVAPDELARYCLHALSAAAGLSSRAAVGRLVAVTLTGLRPGPVGRTPGPKSG